MSRVDFVCLIIGLTMLAGTVGLVAGLALVG
jgi:hypothetical protein